MNKQKYRELQDNKQWIEGYEHNLNLMLDLSKQELSDVNRDRGFQYNTSKTLLWINIVFVGMSVKILEYTPNEWVFIVFVFVTSLSIFFTLSGMITGRYNDYASIGEPEVLTELSNDKWLKTKGYLMVIEAYQRSSKYNGDNIVNRSGWIRKAKISSLCSFVLLLVLSANSLYIHKDINMAKKPVTPTKSTITPTPVRRSNDSASAQPVTKPVIPPSKHFGDTKK